MRSWRIRGCRKPPDTMSEGFLYGSDPRRALPPRAPPRLRDFGMALPLMHCVCPSCPKSPLPKGEGLKSAQRTLRQSPRTQCPRAFCMDLTRGGPCPLGLPRDSEASEWRCRSCTVLPPKPALKRGRLEKCAANATSKPPDTMSEGFLYESDPRRALPPRAPPRLRGFGMALPLMHCVCPSWPQSPLPKGEGLKSAQRTLRQSPRTQCPRAFCMNLTRGGPCPLGLPRGSEASEWRCRSCTVCVRPGPKARSQKGKA